MEKSPEAFRTIREVADAMDLPQHVLRFWETRFPQIKPMKRAGGRRYYRPDDVERLKLIRRLLYDEGFTIAGARQQLRADTKPDKTQAAIPFPSRSTSEIQHIRQGLREILNLLSARKTG